MSIKSGHTTVLDGQRIYLRPVGLDDVNAAYLRWMTDPAVNRFLESRFTEHSLDSLRQFVAEMQRDDCNTFFAIVLKDGDRHIGNIKLGPINERHRLADIGILIGEQDCWGKGLATEAIRLLVRYAFDTLNLHKVTAGSYAPNAASIKAFERAGFVREGLRKSHCLLDGAYVDDVLLGLVRTSAK
jgi:RimJ/RimL family protein N-acetyltransferase